MSVMLDKSLETGLAWQDRQHKELFEKLSALLDGLQRGVGVEEAVKLLEFLDEYVVVHFHDEEQAMSRYGYPDMVTHLEQHTDFIDNLSRLKERLKTERSDEAIDDVKTSVLNWLNEHIRGIDRELGRFLLENAALRAN